VASVRHYYFLVTQYNLVAMATSLDNMVKKYENQFSISGDIQLNTPVFLPCHTRRSQMSSVNSGVTGPKFTIFFTRYTQYRGIIYAVNAPIEVPISYSVSECQSDEKGSLPFFSQNWLPWQRPLRYQKKRSRSIICTENAFIR